MENNTNPFLESLFKPQVDQASKKLTSSKLPEVKIEDEIKMREPAAVFTSKNARNKTQKNQEELMRLTGKIIN